MIDFHTHTLLSDGVLLPSELARRAEVRGYRAVAVTDHVDGSNLEEVVAQTVKVCRRLNARAGGIPVIAGVELTYVPPGEFKELIAYSRQHGIQLVVVHGETLVEPVAPGTNWQALNEDIDILAHPGLLSEEEAGLAAEKSIYVELTTRRGHSLTNGHVAKMCLRAGAKLILNTDAHEPEDLVLSGQARLIVQGAGLSGDEVEAVFRHSEELLKKIRALQK